MEDIYISFPQAEAEIAKMIERKLQELGPPPTEGPPKPPVEEEEASRVTSPSSEK